MLPPGKPEVRLLFSYSFISKLNDVGTLCWYTLSRQDVFFFCDIRIATSFAFPQPSEHYKNHLIDTAFFTPASLAISHTDKSRPHLSAIAFISKYSTFIFECIVIKKCVLLFECASGYNMPVNKIPQPFSTIFAESRKRFCTFLNHYNKKESLYHSCE